MVSTSDEKTEIAFFDVETTVPTRPRQGFAILEFGEILVCPRKLVELHNYSTFVRPADLSHISSLSVVSPKTPSFFPVIFNDNFYHGSSLGISRWQLLQHILGLVSKHIGVLTLDDVRMKLTKAPPYCNCCLKYL